MENLKMPFHLPKIITENLSNEEMEIIRPLLNSDQRICSAFPYHPFKDEQFRKRRYVFVLLMSMIYQDNRFRVPFVSKNDIFNNPVKMGELKGKDYLNKDDKIFCESLVNKLVYSHLRGGFDETVPEYYRTVIDGKD